MKQIVVGTDFSDPAEVAVVAAAEWAKRMEAQVTLVHVLSVPDLEEGELEQAMPEHAELEEAVHAHLDRVAAELLEGIPCRTVMQRGRNAAVAITSLAAELDADLLVVATHGRTGLKRILLGSVAERMVQLAKCPVLTVRSPVEG